MPKVWLLFYNWTIFSRLVTFLAAVANFNNTFETLKGRIRLVDRKYKFCKFYNTR